MNPNSPVTGDSHLALFLGFCKGVEEAVQTLYDKGFAPINKMIKKNKGTSSDAEDVFQEGLIVLFSYCKQEAFRLTTHPAGLLYGICKKLWLKELENRGKSVVTFRDIEEYVNMDRVLDLQEEQKEKARRIRLTWKHLSRLPEKAQKVLQAYYLEGKSHRVIADELGFANEQSARVQKARYLAQLRELTKQDPDFY